MNITAREFAHKVLWDIGKMPQVKYISMRIGDLGTEHVQGTVELLAGERLEVEFRDAN